MVTLMRKILTLLLAGMVLLAGCSPTPASNGSSTPVLPDPVVSVTRAPNAEAVVRAFLEAYRVEDYPAMYAVLTRVSKDTISEEDFTTRYRDVLATLSFESLSYEVLSTLTNPNTAQAAFRLVYNTRLVGQIQRDLVARMSLEDGQWRIQWDEGLILPELSGGNVLQMDYKIPSRGDIYDRNNRALVAQTAYVALGVVPGEIIPEQEETLLTELWGLTGLRPDTIRNLYAFAQPNWYIPVGEAPAESVEKRFGVLSGLGGLRMTNVRSRYYFDSGLAPQTVGYMLSITAENLEFYRRLGYRGDERVGYEGIEAWGEEHLAGKRGGSLYVLSPSGEIVTLLVKSDPVPASSIYLTLDRDLQAQAQRAIEGFRGAIVVMEKDTGRVLAIVSSPGFDTNLFEPGNPNNMLLTGLLNDASQPLFNRATQGQFPLGSVFKIITMASALESGSYTAESTYNCQYFFTELAGRTLNDWTYDKFLKDDKTQPSGLLTLPQGLMRSCNPWFWHIGLDLYNQGKTTAISDMARGFGLGQPTGITGVTEEAGQIPNPADGLQAVNEAIGQGDIQVTPLQVARFAAAVGNGGTLYRPQLIEKIQPIIGDPIMTFKPEAQGALPVSPENLKIIQDAMVSVVDSPRGTANHRMIGLRIPIAGKTGTAESGFGDPHSWFAGYTFANREDKPDIAVSVIVENIGEGSDYAAPIFRRIVEIYFFGRPQSLYWWESGIGITRTPTSPVTETPPAEATPSP